MKTNKSAEQIKAKPSPGSTFKNACVASCQEILAQLKNTKTAILAEARSALEVKEQLLKLALNEAEALAWQTLYPHLLFPTLAAEKIQAVTSWNQHQRFVRLTTQSFSA